MLGAAPLRAPVSVVLRGVTHSATFSGTPSRPLSCSQPTFEPLQAEHSHSGPGQGPGQLVPPRKGRLAPALPHGDCNLGATHWPGILILPPHNTSQVLDRRAGTHLESPFLPVTRSQKESPASARVFTCRELDTPAGPNSQCAGTIKQVQV